MIFMTFVAGLIITSDPAVYAAAVKRDTIDNSVIGINWSPFHHSDYTSSTVEDVMEDDFSRMAASGFNFMRTFYFRHYGVHIAPYAANYSFEVALGVYMYVAQSSWTDKQLTAAAEQARDYPSVVKAIFVGNENVRTDGTGDYTADELISYIEEMKTLLEDYNVTDVAVGTVQRYTEWKSGDSDILAIAAVCDIIGVNLYPFYADIDYDRNIEVFENQLGNVTQALADYNLTIWVTETGYPSGGSDCDSEQTTSVDNEEEYFNNIKEWASNNGTKQIFYFAYFDKESADEQDDKCYNFFGLADAEGNLKFDI